MKINRLGKRIFLLSLLALTGLSALGQKNKLEKQEQIKKLLESRVFVFNPQSATPSSGGMIQLTSEFFVKIRQDTLESNLPYYGVNNQPGFGIAERPLEFTSYDFDYEMKTMKNGSYDITIRLNDPSDPDLLNFSISTSGYATLRVTSNMRQPISFYGDIDAPRPPRKSNR
jgi:hypothetical protein